MSEYTYCSYPDCMEEIPSYNVTGRCKKHWFKKEGD